MFAWGTPPFLARSMTSRSEALVDGSEPPFLTALTISALNLVKTALFLASVASFFRLILLHLECPDIVFFGYDGSVLYLNVNSNGDNAVTNSLD